MTKQKCILPLAILLIYGCSQTFQGLQEWKPHHIHNPQFIPQQTYLDETIVEIPLKIPDRHILVQATIDRENTFWFMLDTGASGVIVSKRIARKMNLPFSENTTKVSTPSGKALFSPLLRVNSLSVGGAEFNNFDALPLDLKNMRKKLKHEVDGILGFPLFANILLTIDYPQQTIFLKKGRLPPKGKEIFDYDLINHKPYLPIPWKGTTVPALIDTGSSFFLTMPKELADDLILSYSMREMAWNIEGTRSDLTGDLEEVQIGQYLISYPRINFAEVSEGILGFVFLHHFVITFDQLQKKVRITKPSATREKIEVYKDALSIFQKREAETGYARIQYHLGWMYHRGYGVEKNISMAIRWYKKAAEQGNPKAQQALEHLEGTDTTIKLDWGIKPFK
jgi:predicted aspartyl protease